MQFLRILARRAGMIFFLFGLYYAILATTLGVAIWLAWVAFHKPRPPVTLLFLVLLLGIPLPVLYFALVNSWGGDVASTVIVLAEAAVFSATAIMICFRRFCSWTNARSLASGVSIVVAGLVWLELKFCVIVSDSDGNPVETNPKDLYMCYQGSGFSAPYHRIDGVRLRKGCIYFGFCRWTVFQKR